jgi:hypothetical protein
MNETNSQGPTDGNPSGMSPTSEDRMALVRAFQREAMKRPDPLAANLGVIAADLMGFAHGLAARVQESLSRAATSSGGRQQFVQNADLYLKFVRQIDRLAQLERQLSRPSKGEEKGN